VLVYGAGTVGSGGTWPAAAQFSLLIMVKTSFKAKAHCAIQSRIVHDDNYLCGAQHFHLPAI